MTNNERVNKYMNKYIKEYMNKYVGKYVDKVHMKKISLITSSAPPPIEVSRMSLKLQSMITN